MAKGISIKKNDIVRVISGRDRGKQGKVTQVFPREGMVVVEGVNIRVRHLKTRQSGRTGSKVQYSAPLPTSKVMVVCPHCNRAVRVRMQVAADSRKLRVCHRCGQALTAA